jgi:hypothetical protein
LGNKFREIVKEQREEKKVTEKKQQTVKNAPVRKGFLYKILSLVFGGTFLGNEKAFKHIPYVLFLCSLGLFYIANGYWADGKIRMQNKLIAEIKELRSEYISSKSDLMFISKQSEVAKAVEKLGIREPVVPPMKILVTDSVNQK